MLFVRQKLCFTGVICVCYLLGVSACRSDSADNLTADRMGIHEYQLMQIKIDSIIKLATALDTLPELDSVFLPKQLEQIEQQFSIIHRLQSLIVTVADSGYSDSLANFQEISAAVASRYAGLKAQLEVMEEMRGSWERPFLKE